MLVRPAGLSFSFSDPEHGSGVAATQTRSVAPFTGIYLPGVSTVSVHVGVKQTVVVHADSNLIARVTTDVRNGTLVIAERGNFSNERPVSVEVTVPRLDGVALSGSGHVNVEGARARKFTVRESGSGALTVTGAVEELDTSLSGSGNVQLQDLAARDVKATLSGSVVSTCEPAEPSMHRSPAADRSSTAATQGL